MASHKSPFTMYATAHGVGSMQGVLSTHSSVEKASTSSVCLHYSTVPLYCVCTTQRERPPLTGP